MGTDRLPNAEAERRQPNADCSSGTASWILPAAPRIFPAMGRRYFGVTLARPLVDAVQRGDRDLASWFFNHSSASQLRCAVSSIALNLSKKFGCSGGNSRLRFQTAQGSLRESQMAVRIAVSWGYVSQGSVQALLDGLDRLGKRVFGLLRN